MKPLAYYNEHDLKTAAWLRALITEGLVADGEVDTRSVVDVRPADLAGFGQCHFFAGIGGWSYALRLAGWPDDRAVWTGSCPCQPFSSAGAQIGGDDPRHLWPAWFRLIRECRPAIVFGEQVEAALAHGWLDLVCDDLEGEGYACGAVGLPAACVGAPHIRQRVWFVAESDGATSERDAGGFSRAQAPERGARLADGDLADGPSNGRAVGELADGDDPRCRAGRTDEAGDGRDAPREQPARLRDAGLMGDTDESRSQGRDSRKLSERPCQRTPWAASHLVWLPCRDGKARPTQSGLQPLAHGVRNRILALRGAGNAIVPHVAAEVIAAFMEIAR